LFGLTPYDWLGSTDTALGWFVFINAWQFTGFGTIIYLVGLNSIPVELLESAQVDGAEGFKKFFLITLPLMMHSITIALFMGLTGSLQMFVLPFIMTGGGPLDSTLTFAMNIYENAFRFQRFGYAAALAILFTLFIGAISVIQLRITRKREVDY
jgi:ABC-type sugar transport system permease subunit